VLKPGGIFGVVQHRADDGADPKESAKTGYVPEPYVVELATAAGFTLVERSDLNRNPADTHDHPEGVWTLPPSLRLGETDRAKYEAIGESDRMTLKFQKPAQ
jgi:predicted methyltransferase